MDGLGCVTEAVGPSCCVECAGTFVTPRVNSKTFGGKSLFYAGPSVWNNLPHWLVGWSVFNINFVLAIDALFMLYPTIRKENGHSFMYSCIFGKGWVDRGRLYFIGMSVHW